MADTPQRIVPEVGIIILDVDYQKLRDCAGQLKQKINELRKSEHAKVQDLIPDVEIYYNAVHYALEQDIFYDEADVEIAEGLLKYGIERANQLDQGGHRGQKKLDW